LPPYSGVVQKMNVLRLVRYSCKETVSILKVLLSLALQGKLRGLMVCYRTEDGTEDTVFTGLYKDHPSAAASACLRVSMQQLHARTE
jgi:hypothetical protein